MKTRSALLVAALVGAVVPAHAADPAPFTGNITLASDYKFRGFSQTNFKPALQGGFDYADKSGFYLGNWNSNVEQSLYNGASLEMDVYGGYKGTAGAVSYDLGAIYYAYPGSAGPKIDNKEVYVGLGTGPFTTSTSPTATTSKVVLSLTEGSGDRLAQGPDRDDPHPVWRRFGGRAPARCRNDGCGESVASGLAQTAREPRYRAELSEESDFADGDERAVDGAVALRRSEREGKRQVERRLVENDATNEVCVDVAIAQCDPGTPRQHGSEQR